MKSKWGKRIGYGTGGLGCNLVFSTMSSYLLIFYTDVSGIAAAGTMMLVTKLIDAVTDTILCVLLAVTNAFWKLDACAGEMRAELDSRRKKLRELADRG